VRGAVLKIQGLELELQVGSHWERASGVKEENCLEFSLLHPDLLLIGQIQGFHGCRLCM
jgi:hypothetical protein